MSLTTDAGGPAPANGSFVFVSPFLAQPSAVFVRAIDRQPMLQIDLGGHKASYPLEAVPKAAELSTGHPDRAMLRHVRPALMYRDQVTSGDRIPSELTDGRPSWTPDSALQAQVVRRILEILSADAATDDAATVGDASAAIARRLIGVDNKRNPDIVGSIRDMLDAAACAMELRGKLTDCQRMVGEMATRSADRKPFAGQERLRDSAVKLRNVMVWASKRTMALDMLAQDVRAAVEDQDRLTDRIWPAVNELRAWWLDLSPVIRAWQAASSVTPELRVSDIESLHRLVTIRYAEFDPDIYRTKPAGSAAGTGNQRSFSS